MRISAALCLLALGATAAQASWFGSDQSTATPSPSQWTVDQLSRAQSAFQNIKESAFDSWDESRLREFLLDQGVIEPKGTREHLALLAKQRYRQYNSAASSASASASSLASVASKSATSLAGQASKTASTAVYGDSKYQASKSASSLAAQATDNISRKLEESKDYVFSTWDDNRLRKFLEEKGAIKPKHPATREQLLAKTQELYAKTTQPAWQVWSDSYLHEWLVDRGIIKSQEQKKREELVSLMNKYFYDTKDTVYSSWSDSQLRHWLIDRGIVKSDAQLEREKLQKLVADNYLNAKDTIWSSWKDSDMRDWLIAHGYLKSDEQKSRDELIDLMHQKYNDYSTRVAAYLVWPDARLRVYLREHGISEEALPTSRPGLLQEVRIRWVQSTNRSEAIFNKIRDIVNSSVEAAEEKLGQILNIVTGHAETAKARSEEYAAEKVDDVKAKTAGAKVTAKENESAGKKYWNEKVEDAKKAADQAKVEL